MTSHQLKPWVMNFWWSSLIDNVSQILSQSLAKDFILCDSTGRELFKFVPGFLQILPSCLFIFTDFALCPFAIMTMSITICWVLWITKPKGDLGDPWHTLESSTYELLFPFHTLVAIWPWTIYLSTLHLSIFIYILKLLSSWIVRIMWAYFVLDTEWLPLPLDLL